MKSSQETCCTETVIFGGKICTVRKFYIVGILEQQSRVCAYFAVQPITEELYASGTGEVPIFVPSSETSRFLRVSASHACMNEHLCAEIYLARANSEMQRSGIELACL